MLCKIFTYLNFAGLRNQSKDKVVGPKLPQHLCNQSSVDDDFSPPVASGVIGPALPPGMSSVRKSSIGPALPPGMSHGPEEATGNDVIGPTLPPHLRREVGKSDNENVIGPCLPPHLTVKSRLRSDSSSDDDTDVIGPMPSEMLKGDGSVSTMVEIESRARNMKNRLEGKVIY